MLRCPNIVTITTTKTTTILLFLLSRFATIKVKFYNVYLSYFFWIIFIWLLFVKYFLKHWFWLDLTGQKYIYFQVINPWIFLLFYEINWNLFDVSCKYLSMKAISYIYNMNIYLKNKICFRNCPFKYKDTSSSCILNNYFLHFET